MVFRFVRSWSRRHRLQLRHFVYHSLLHADDPPRPLALGMAIGMFVAFTHNLIHVILVLVLVVPLSTWFFQLSGRIYLGAAVSAALVAWMFASSQVVAPIPV